LTNDWSRTVVSLENSGGDLQCSPGLFQSLNFYLQGGKIMDKSAIINLLLGKFLTQVDIVEQNMKMQKEFLADSPGPMQSRYDSALVEGQWLLASMETNLNSMLKNVAYLRRLGQKNARYETVREGSLVTLSNGGRQMYYLLLGSAGKGSFAVECDGRKVMTLTSSSPVGKAIMGKKTGDRVQIRTSKVMDYVVEAIL
jgi:transcription elongation GreA/GreB family factor